MAERNTRIRATQIRSIFPVDIESTNSETDNYFITYDSSSQKFTWEALEGTINFIIDGGGEVVSTGIVPGCIQFGFNCEILECNLLADQSGSIQVDIWKDTYANYPPTDADSITASAVPAISSAIKSTDSTLTGWTKTISAGDILYFNVDSVSTITWCTLVLKVRRT